jgi:hypothetical protein
LVVPYCSASFIEPFVSWDVRLSLEFNVIIIHWLGSESCTWIRIIIASKCYWLTIYQIDDMLFKDRVMMHLLWGLVSQFSSRPRSSSNWNNSLRWNEW